MKFEVNDIVGYKGKLAVVTVVDDDGMIGILPQVIKARPENLQMVRKGNHKLHFRGKWYTRLYTFPKPGSVQIIIENKYGNRQISITHLELEKAWRDKNKPAVEDWLTQEDPHATIVK